MNIQNLEVGCLEGRRPTKHWSAAALYDAAAAEEIKTANQNIK